MKTDITIDLQDIDITGNILDISIKGNNIIPEIINMDKGELEKDFVLWGSSKTDMEDEFYDSAFALFSLGTIKGRKNIENILLETSRVLRKGGRLLVWDLNRGRLTLKRGYNIKVILPQNRRGRIHLRTGFSPLRVEFNDFIKLLEKCHFKIILSSKNGNTFYIEAEKDGDVKVENSSGIA